MPPIEPGRISLVPFAPGSPLNTAELSRLADALADILNTDMGGASTGQQALDYAIQWCHQHKAVNYVVLLDGDKVVGNISLSHIDQDARTARCGWIVAKAYQELGIEDAAVDAIIAIAIRQGITVLGSKCRKDDQDGQEFWRRRGAGFVPTTRDSHILAQLTLAAD
ncbi:GNAT family N-acetyltransferase [Magnetospirillum moscoviense]|uniref:N-acetyltransferase domain-containing protein n=1 Tax=Magnetospirillum moscoviense TaxID=1437059 RepID=A0A178M9L6_9PROT|nr:GNAT family N-acetyltransferase [Magnetospirillum moscoviense]OAN44897.1 hypothetical protein A6A05_17265 [Magnetospirillum moscoviense]